MKNNMTFMGLIMFFIMGMAGLNVFLGNHSIPRKPSPLSRIKAQVNNNEPVFNQKEGWGFVKSKEGKTPEITELQRNLVRKYNALFTGNVSAKNVTFTFDMGYEKEGLTPKILNVLKKYNVQASFFVAAYWIEKNPELAKMAIREGHVLGNHTVKHKSLPTISDQEVKEEILGWERVAWEQANYKIKYKFMRPPMGEYSERTLGITKELGYRTAFWSAAIVDWLPMGSPDEAVRGIVSQLHNGAVILLHGNSEDVANGLEEIIIKTREKGYRIVPIYKI